MSEKHREDEIRLDARNASERTTLVWVLAINLLQVIVAGVVGVFADSTGLLGAALDNMGDAGVYAISLYAVGRTVVAKVRVARLSGILLIALGLALFVEVGRRFFVGAEPIGLAMIITAFINAALNVICLKLLRSHRDQGVHLKASWIFTTNDMIANAGIVVSGAAVMFFASPYPDLVIGVLVAGIVLRGGWEILEEAKDAS
ncbi:MULTISPECIES: cation transporter [Hyphomicrobiales]|jgi:Co/Zn/Cd efflux system component|uniref:Cation transporter n=2 Tax=Hyphomicrobiales TaxID=356 RepID=A0AA50CVK4_9HYPH|nr:MULTISPECIES: cation transporter [Hyphomicrobiales]OYR08587.1 cation efflux family protein [Brucella grignonensis]WLS01323.1 cation transporter [Shinella sumterensis]WLS11988.1 cation transporter [Shinella sumterensis]